MTSSSKEYDSRVCLSSKDLIAQRALAKGFAANPRAAINNQFVGRHYSSQRGRGLNFEELSHYRIGDDTRMMDWKVTNRTGKPHVRVFTEERERPIMLVVDQRQSMFFGSQEKMKSVVAAETMALLAWRHIALGDAVASLLFNDTKEFDSKPHRSSELLLQDFGYLSKLNRSLLVTSANKSTVDSSTSLTRTLSRLNALCRHDYVVVFISDFYGFNERAGSLLKSLSLRNDLVVVNIQDQIEGSLPPNTQFIAGDGQLQLAVNTDDKKIASEYAAQAKLKQKRITKLCRTLAVPYVEMNTSDSASQQLRLQLPELAVKAPSAQRRMEQRNSAL